MAMMASRNKTKRAPLKIGGETFGQRLARIRKEKGYTQVELADKVGMVQVVISDYELDKLRPYHDTVLRFAEAFGMSTDELLGAKQVKSKGTDLSLKIMRRMRKIEALPQARQKVLLQSIDMFLKGAGASDK
jgi:transcriptional regulator with XRE-family HTH domain